MTKSETLYAPKLLAWATLPLIFAALLFATKPALANGLVTLKSLDHTLEVTGVLKSAENGFYTIETLLGDVKVEIEKVTCFGYYCPDMVQDSVEPEAVQPLDQDSLRQAKLEEDESDTAGPQLRLLN